MPSFDISSEVDLSEVKNAVLMTRKELQNRFDFKGVEWDIEEQANLLVITADDDYKLRAIDQTLMTKLAKRDLPLKNFEHLNVSVSNMGRARQEIKIKQGLESDVAKKITKLIKGSGIKVQAQVHEDKVRVTGKSRDDLQQVIAYVKAADLSVGVSFDNFRS